MFSKLVFCIGDFTHRYIYLYDFTAAATLQPEQTNLFKIIIQVLYKIHKKSVSWFFEGSQIESLAFRSLLRSKGYYPYILGTLQTVVFCEQLNSTKIRHLAWMIHLSAYLFWCSLNLIMPAIIIVPFLTKYKIIYQDLKYSNKPTFFLSLVSDYSFGKPRLRLLRKRIEN